MSNAALYAIAGGTTCLLLTFVFCAFAVARRADDLDEQAWQQRADRQSFPRVLLPEDAPRATAPTGGAGETFAHSFHAAISSQKGQRDNV